MLNWTVIHICLWIWRLCQFFFLIFLYIKTYNVWMFAVNSILLQKLVNRFLVELVVVFGPVCPFQLIKYVKMFV